MVRSKPSEPPVSPACADLRIGAGGSPRQGHDPGIRIEPVAYSGLPEMAAPRSLRDHQRGSLAADGRPAREPGPSRSAGGQAAQSGLRRRRETRRFAPPPSLTRMPGPRCRLRVRALRFAEASDAELAALEGAFAPAYATSTGTRRRRRSSSASGRSRRPPRPSRRSPYRRPALARRRSKPVGERGRRPHTLNGTYRYTLTKDDARKAGETDLSGLPRTNT